MSYDSKYEARVKVEKLKQSLYFPEPMLAEINAEANRQDRSLSWIVQQAWRIAHPEVKKFPGTDDMKPKEK